MSESTTTMNTRKQVVFVTGASKGVGLAVTTILLKELSSKVVAVSRTRSSAIRRLQEEHPADFLFHEADVTDESAMRHEIRAAINTYEHLDGLILNAGAFQLGRIRDPETTTESWRASFNLNFFTLLYTVQEALPSLLKSEFGGRVICVSSGSAEANTPALGSYNASKAAMNSFCRTLGAEEPDIVTIALRPHMTDTNMADSILGSENSDKVDPAFREMLQKRIKSGQLAKAEDVGYCIASLALKAPSTLSGQFVDWKSDECKDFRRK